MVKVPAQGRAKAFYIDRAEVSWLDYLRMVAFLRWGVRTDQTEHPTHGAWLTYADAKEYCDWAGKRLPTFDEWQRAAGPDAKKSLGEDPQPVDARPPNGLGVFGLENGILEWTRTDSKEAGFKLVGELDMDPPQVQTDEEVKLGLHCAADAGKVQPLKKATGKISLFGAVGVCARLESTRETYCWDGLPETLGPEAPQLSRQPRRATVLDGAVDFSRKGILWSTAIAGPLLLDMIAAQDDPFALLTAEGGIYSLDHSGTLIFVAGTRGDDLGYGMPHQTVKQVFEAQGGFLVQEFDGNWNWAGWNGLADYHPKPEPVKLGVSPSAVLQLEDELCLRSGDSLACGRFSPGKFNQGRKVDLPVRSISIAGPSCILLDSGALHCFHGKLTSETLTQALPPAVLTDIVDIQGGTGMVCALDRQDHVSCTTRELQNEQLARGTTSGDIRFERIELPEAK